MQQVGEIVEQVVGQGARGAVQVKETRAIPWAGGLLRDPVRRQTVVEVRRSHSWLLAQPAHKQVGDQCQEKADKDRGGQRNEAGEAASLDSDVPRQLSQRKAKAIGSPEQSAQQREPETEEEEPSTDGRKVGHRLHLGEARLSRGRGLEPEVTIGTRRRHATLRRAVDETELEEVRLDDVHDGIRFLAD